LSFKNPDIVITYKVEEFCWILRYQNDSFLRSD